MAAPPSLHEAEEIDRSLPFDAPQFRIVDVVQETLVQLDVGPGIEKHTVALEPVPPGAPDLLVPRLDVLRHIAVDHVAHVRLVDAHPERHGRDDDVNVVVLERILVGLAHVGRQSGVVRTRAHALLAEERCGLLHAPSAEAVHDAALTLPAPDKSEDLFARIPDPLLATPDQQIGSEERALEARGVGHAELAKDVSSHGLRSGRGERQDRYVEAVLQALQPPIGRPEVVSPLADTVRLIDYQERDRTALDEVS